MLGAEGDAYQQPMNGSDYHAANTVGMNVQAQVII